MPGKPSGEEISLRKTIMPEVYEATAEHQRRVNDPEDQALDSDDTSILDCVSALAIHSGELIAIIASGDIPKRMVHRLATILATDALEIARRVRPK